jgi:two-component system, cell cycle sensor histidine kinase and response regulator CckA
MSTALRVLIVEDSPDDAALVLRELRRGGYELVSERVETAEAMSAALERAEWDVILSDYTMPHFSALEALETLKSKQLDIPFIIISGTIGEETAVLALKAGAQDYLIKGRLARLVPALEREIREAHSRLERKLAEAENRKLEEQFHQAQKMEAVGRLAGGLAHDFNNFLSAINGYCQMMLNTLDRSDPTRAWLEEIKKAGDHAASLMRELLAFSRQHVLVTQVLDLNEVVAGVENMLRHLIGKDIDLVTLAAPALWQVKADAARIKQVIVNLAVNARDAMPGGGRLTIETSNVELDAASAQRHPSITPGRYVMLAVSDTGIGMDAQTQAHVFEPFFTTKDEGKGTGLGLAIVYGTVKQSGGAVWIDSELGQGAKFTIYLPQAEECPATPEAAYAPRPDPRIARGLAGRRKHAPELP